MTRGRLRIVLLALLAVTSAAPLSVVGTTTAAATDGPTNSAATQQAETPDSLVLDHRLERLPDQPGHVRVTVETSIPTQVSEVRLTPPEDAETVAGDDFGETDDGEWVWNREGSGEASPTLTYTVPVNATDDGRLDAVATGEWALFNWRTVDTRWGYTAGADAPDPTVVEDATPVGEGVVGPGYAYLGPHETLTRTVDGETVRLVVPDAADPVERPSELLDALAGASRDLRIGARNDRVTVFVAPAPIEATGRTSRAGPAGNEDLYVAADEPLDSADNAWFHEYVHTRQHFATSDGMAWVEEASAEYYAARLAHEGGYVDESAFIDYVRTDRAADAVLAEADGGDVDGGDGSDAAYFKGMRVLAALDADVRASTDGRRSLDAVVRQLNAREGTIDRTAFADVVADVAGEPYDDWLDTYVATDAVPPVRGDATDSRTTEGPNGLGDGSLSAVRLPGVGLFVAAALVAGVTAATRLRRH